ncbi:hypothetical protein HK098_005746, partial [Nowakowskiella sp. JEL0407]
MKVHSLAVQQKLSSNAILQTLLSTAHDSHFVFANIDKPPGMALLLPSSPLTLLCRWHCEAKKIMTFGGGSLQMEVYEIKHGFVVGDEMSSMSRLRCRFPGSTIHFIQYIKVPLEHRIPVSIQTAKTLPHTIPEVKIDAILTAKNIDTPKKAIFERYKRNHSWIEEIFSPNHAQKKHRRQSSTDQHELSEKLEELQNLERELSLKYTEKLNHVEENRKKMKEMFDSLNNCKSKEHGRKKEKLSDDVISAQKAKQAVKIAESKELIYEKCLQEFQFSELTLRRNPKSYWVFNHRRWVLDVIAEPGAWERELKLVEKMLDLDPRNFHGWDYRRYIMQKSSLQSPQQEFNYTSTKISQNFSNYSAWHYRSKVLHGAFGGSERDGVVQQDFELVRNAYYTEPSDQSAWLYHRWLLGEDQYPILVSSAYKFSSYAIVVIFNQEVKLKLDNQHEIKIESGTENVMSQVYYIHNVNDTNTVVIPKFVFSDARETYWNEEIKLIFNETNEITIEQNQNDTLNLPKSQPREIWQRERKSIE